jgi:hypothetical protein
MRSEEFAVRTGACGDHSSESFAVAPRKTTHERRAPRWKRHCADKRILCTIFLSNSLRTRLTDLIGTRNSNRNAAGWPVRLARFSSQVYRFGKTMCKKRHKKISIRTHQYTSTLT